ncbi:MAG: peptidase U32 family protein [Planctomycetota bacterium]
MLDRPELLAPAGDEDSLSAAIENGADAVYFGLRDGFNARAKARNFALDDLPRVMHSLRRRGVRGYVTLNTLVFADEMPRLEAIARAASEVGVDAVLVQDFGAARLLRAVCADLPLHASTQMTLTSAECIEAARSLGIERVVLPRELSLAEIAAIHNATDIELEVFVHGALCISYSGQCLASLTLHGRSANRGACAQVCRLPFDLLGATKAPSTGGRYLLSPRDLAAFDLLPELIAAGVTAFKIEGRMKSAEYVAAVTSCYRRGIDAALAGRPERLTSADRSELEIAFSRGFSHGWLHGPNANLIASDFSSHRGMLVGTVVAVLPPRVRIALAAELHRGDGVVFEGDRFEGQEQGGRVFEIFADGESVARSDAGRHVETAFARGQIDFRRLRPGLQLWKTDDPKLRRELRGTFAGGDARRRVPIDLDITAVAGERLRLRARTATGYECGIQSPETLPAATQHPLTAELLSEQLGRLGGSVYELRSLEARIEGAPMAPFSVLGSLRRALIESLDAAASAPPLRRVSPPGALARIQLHRTSCISPPAPSEPQIYVLCRSLAQVKAVLESNVAVAIADLATREDMSEAARLMRNCGRAVAVASPRIHKPGETGFREAVARWQPTVVLARNLAALQVAVATGAATVADFSLNAANPWSVDWLLSLGAVRVTLACDLSARKETDLLARIDPRVVEFPTHFPAPLMHTEVCIFCALRGCAECGQRRPGDCPAGKVSLGDARGNRYKVHGDIQCRNTIFFPNATLDEKRVCRVRRAGVEHFRIELLDEDSSRILLLINELRSKLGSDSSAVEGSASRNVPTQPPAAS